MTREEKAKRREAMREYKAQGHTNREVAKRFGVTEGYTVQVCKGICPQKPKVAPKNKGILKPEDEVSRDIEQRQNGFEYAGNYTGTDGRADLRCKACGTVSNWSMITVRHKKIRCRHCEELAKQEKLKEAENEKERKAEARRISAELRRVGRATQLSFTRCKECGLVFYSWDSRIKYCSDKCKRKASNHYNLMGSDDRLNRTNIVDRDITLEKLFERDGGVCQVCGRLCDWNDCATNENGVFIAGEKYPSKDHIVPLSMGGKHSWDNIRLAHRGCNVKVFNEVQRYAPIPATSAK